MPREVVDAETERRSAREARLVAKALAVEQDRQIRLTSVARDLELGLPISIQQPDGEEFPRKCHMQLRTYDQQAEIVKGFIQGPPNKTICNSSDWGNSGSGLEVKGQGRTTSKQTACSCPLPAQLQGPFLPFRKPTSVSGKSSPPHSRAPTCNVHSRPSSAKGPSKGKDSKGGSPSGSTHSSTTSLSTSQPHKPTFAEKILSSMFSDRSNQPNNNSSPGGGGGGGGRLLPDETKCKSSSKSSKVKSQSSSAFGKIKDFKTFSNLPPTEAQVYAVTIRSADGSGNGKIGAGKVESVSDRPSTDHADRPPTDHSDHLGRFQSEQFEPHMRSDESSDRNGNERERAYSDSMVRNSHESSLPASTSDLSQSRMSLCYEGEEWTGGPATEPQGPPCSPRMSEHDPTSFLYQHIHQSPPPPPPPIA